jgi:hypothetical protein
MHQKTIATFVELKNQKIMDVPQIEAVLPNSFVQLNEVITKILKDNNIIPDEEESKVD